MIISVIIPIYNTPPNRLVRCIDSLIKGEYEDLEILIVDDGSDTQYSKQYMKISQKDRRIKYLFKENGGPALARNFGVLHAKGEYITFVDSDDFVTSYCFVQAADVIRKWHPDLVMGLVKKCAGNNKTENYQKPFKISTQKIISQEEHKNLINHVLGYTNLNLKYTAGYIGDGPVARIFLRELFEEIKFDDKPFWSEDTVWNIKLVKKCKKIIIVESTWYIYSVYKKSLTQKYRKNCLMEFTFRINQEHELMTELWPDCMEGIYVRIWSEIFILCRLLIFHPDNPFSDFQKYQLLKKAINTKIYQKTLRKIDFNYHQNIFKKISKYLLNLTMLHKWYFITFIFLKYKSKPTSLLKKMEK